MRPVPCGIDFGTSNSSLGMMAGDTPVLIALEGPQTSLPSALFYPENGGAPTVGREAIEAYTAHEEGRFLRALKSILGSGLMAETTSIGGGRKSFNAIVGDFLGHLKRKAEALAGREISSVVLGRPVHFVDDDAKRDALAQTQLEEAARAQGFTHIAFQFEPIAAAMDYERQVTREEIALVADIGGGTSDFSIVRVSPQRKKQADRTQDVLGNTGVHVGGTTLDLRLSMAQIMPEFGYKTRQRARSELEVPSHYYFELAQWHRIVFLYAPKTVMELEQMRRLAAESEKIARLLKIVQEQQGHRLAGNAEAAKIALSREEETRIDLGFVEKNWGVQVKRKVFEASIEAERAKIQASIEACIAQAGVKPSRIDTLFLTGGSTMIPAVTAACRAATPCARMVSGDIFGSVGTGLTLDAQAKFGR